ncbi:MAG: hypothetical protein QXE80_03330 [Pyrobaculum sp.]
MTKLGSIVLPRLLKIAENDEKRKNKSETFRNVAEGFAGLATAASGALGAYALIDEILKRRKEKRTREQLMNEQYNLYLSEAAKNRAPKPEATYPAEQLNFAQEKAAQERRALIDEILEKAAEVKHFASPKDIVQFKKELEQASDTELRKIAYEIDMQYKIKQLELGTPQEKTAADSELDPLTLWLINKF